MLPEYETYCCARLRELIDENSAVVRLRRILSNSASEHFEKSFVEQLESIEKALGTNAAHVEKAKKMLTGGEVLSLLIVGYIKRLGVSIERLRSLYIWLQSNIEVPFRLVAAGFQAFLVSDLKDRHAIWADDDLADNIIIGAEENEDANIVICVNKILNEFMVRRGYPKALVRWHFFHDYVENPVIVIPPASIYQRDENK